MCSDQGNAPDQKRDGADWNDKRLLHPSSVSGCWASLVDIRSAKISREDHAVFTHPVIVQNDWHAFDCAIGVDKREAHSPMEGNRVAIDRSGHTSSSATAKRGSSCKERFIEESPQPLSTTRGMHTKEVDIGLVGKGLRNESDDEPYDMSIIHGDEAGGVEVDEEGFGEHCGHRPTTPPFIYDRDYRLIVVLLYMSDNDHGYGLLLSTQYAQLFLRWFR